MFRILLAGQRLEDAAHGRRQQEQECTKRDERYSHEEGVEGAHRAGDEKEQARHHQTQHRLPTHRVRHRRSAGRDVVNRGRRLEMGGRDAAPTTFLRGRLSGSRFLCNPIVRAVFHNRHFVTKREFTEARRHNMRQASCQLLGVV
uniref:Uncharacterized protein n=1 Tax=Rhipicephalus zambeziensis TaxID=60191 RepID=A0A224YG91_9ACAR